MFQIKLSEVTGSGKQGRVMKDDIERFIKDQGAPGDAAAGACSASRTHFSFTFVLWRMVITVLPTAIKRRFTAIMFPSEFRCLSNVFATTAVSYKPTGIAEPEIRVPAPQPVKPRVYVSKEDRVEAIKGDESAAFVIQISSFTAS